MTNASGVTEIKRLRTGRRHATLVVLTREGRVVDPGVSTPPAFSGFTIHKCRQRAWSTGGGQKCQRRLKDPGFLVAATRQMWSLPSLRRRLSSGGVAERAALDRADWPESSGWVPVGGDRRAPNPLEDANGSVPRRLGRNRARGSNGGRPAGGRWRRSGHWDLTI
jgi:hypothetical protein